jgi:hypothetical protein
MGYNITMQTGPAEPIYDSTPHVKTPLHAECRHFRSFVVVGVGLALA